MYVLADLEWFEDKEKRISLTQISLVRVDEKWGSFRRIYRRIQPLPYSFPDWTHPAFSGGPDVAFLRAQNESQAMGDIRRWLWPSDIICWWHPEAMTLMRKRFPGISNKQIVLTDLVKHHLGLEYRKNPYLIGEDLSLELPAPMHDARNDTEMMRLVLEHLEFPQPVPESIPNKAPQDQRGARGMTYQAHTDTNTIHRKGCSQIPEDGELIGYTDLRKPVGKGFAPCGCVEAEFRAARRARNQSIIDRTEYCFLYAPGSRIFHRRGCKAVLNARDIKGSVRYVKCEDLHLRPCKLCTPSPEHETREHLIQIPAKKPTKSPPSNGSELSAGEQRAIGRLRQAQEQRTSVERNTALTKKQREAQCTLSKTTYTFFAARGYQNFHLRNCRNLSGLTDIKGFARYDEARRYGYQPCKYCRPSPKHDVTVSIPIYSTDRKDESPHVLKDLCLRFGYEYWEEAGIRYVKTAVSIWRIGESGPPYRLGHINLAKTPDNTADFHHQPRLLLSLRDVFYYIQRHDDILLLAWDGSGYVPK